MQAVCSHAAGWAFLLSRTGGIPEVEHILQICHRCAALPACLRQRPDVDSKQPAVEGHS